MAQKCAIDKSIQIEVEWNDNIHTHTRARLLNFEMHSNQHRIAFIHHTRERSSRTGHVAKSSPDVHIILTLMKKMRWWQSSLDD